MKLTDFDYYLPRDLIAQYPLKKRDAVKLLVLNRKSKKIEHRIFKDITDYLEKDDLLVLNDTMVLSCRLKAKRLTGGKVELLLLNQNQNDNRTFDALIKPSRIKIGEKIIFDGGKIYGTVSAEKQITFSTASINTIYNLGMMPLPPYIKREPEKLDNICYQTVYAVNPGAIASPTAGLHFTKELMKRIKSKSINLGFLTLHIGYSTFKPVKSEDVTGHRMEKEYFNIPESTQRLIEEAQYKKSRIVAVGTTSLRALESYDSKMKDGYTDLFIYPGYKFKLVDCLLTNFHLPRTTLFILACAFAGNKLIKKAYQEAIDKKYRFYSYGDAMLII